MSDTAEQQIRLGRRLRAAREIAGLSQEAVAKKLGLQRPAVSEIEAGRRKVAAHELATMSALYHTSMEWLVSGESDTPDKLALAARGLAALKTNELDKILDVLQSLRDPEAK